MTINDLLALTRAGFTKADIEAMGIIQPQNTTKPEEAKPEEANPENTKPEEVKPEVQDDDKIKALETKLDYVINRFNYMAVKDSNQPQQKEETIDDILAAMVRK